MPGSPLLHVVRGATDRTLALATAGVRGTAQVLGALWPLNEEATRNAAEAAADCADAASQREQVLREAEALRRQAPDSTSGGL